MIGASSTPRSQRVGSVGAEPRAKCGISLFAPVITDRSVAGGMERLPKGAVASRASAALSIQARVPAQGPGSAHAESKEVMVLPPKAPLVPWLSLFRMLFEKNG